MDVLDAIRTRRSIRKFLDIPVEWEKIGEMLEAGSLAPSAGNIQDWKFIVLVDSEIREKVASACAGQEWMTNAPVHIIVVAEPVKSNRFYGERGEKVYSLMNAAAAAENMLLVAHRNGLGACWVSAFDEDRLKLALSIPPEAKPMAVITVGYPDEAPVTPMKFGLDVLVYFDQWGSRFKDIAAVKGEYDVKVQKFLRRAKAVVVKAKKALSK